MIQFMPIEEFGKYKTCQKITLKCIEDKIGKFIAPGNEDFILYLLSLPEIDGLIKPEKVFMDRSRINFDATTYPNITKYLEANKEAIYAYLMNEVKNAQTITNYLNNPQFPVDIQNTILRLFTILDEIHKYFVFCDIHNKNILLTRDSSYFIDSDSGYSIYKPKQQEDTTLYNIYLNNNRFTNSILTDTTKLFITALSLYYNYNLERINYYNLTEYENLLQKIEAHPLILEYIHSLIMDLTNGLTTPSVDFKELIREIPIPTEEQRIRCINYLSRKKNKIA